jgi:hypothetical protein
MLNKLLSKISSLYGYSSCHCCGTTWNLCKEHATPFNKNSSMFPLCETCWSKLSPEERLPYYYQLINQWGKDSITEEKIETMKKNVLNGL